MCRFSIIIPAYNVKEYIKDCLEIIALQDFDDYEVVIVDDGSTDGTSLYLDMQTNDHYKIIHKENGGLSSARNVGIEAASGDYYIFLDSDDFWIYNNTLSVIDNIIRTYNSDLLLLSHLKIVEKCDAPYGAFYNTEVDISCNLASLIHKRKYKACSWDKIVRADIIKNNFMQFPEGKLAEDVVWCCNLLNYCSTITYADIPYYGYRMRDNSITHSQSNKNLYNRFLARLEESLEAYEIANNRYSKMYAACEYSCTFKVIPKSVKKDDYLRLLKNKRLLLETKRMDAFLVYIFVSLIPFQIARRLIGR